MMDEIGTLESSGFLLLLTLVENPIHKIFHNALDFFYVIEFCLLNDIFFNLFRSRKISPLMKFKTEKKCRTIILSSHLHDESIIVLAS